MISANGNEISINGDKNQIKLEFAEIVYLLNETAGIEFVMDALALGLEGEDDKG